MTTPSFIHCGREASALAGQASTVYGFTATAGSPAHTKGAWVEIEDSLPFDTDWVEFRNVGVWTGDWYQFLIDIAIGPSYQIVIQNLLYYNAYEGVYNEPGYGFAVPLRLPQGTSVSFRCQCTTASKQVAMVAHFYQAGAAHGWEPSYRTATVGADTTSTGGQVVTPDTTAGVWGAWTQITGSTPCDARYLLLALSTILHTGTSNWWWVDLAVGGGGQEYAFLPSMWFHCTHNRFGIHPPYVVVPCSIPEGSALRMRTAYGANGTPGQYAFHAVAVLLN